MSFYLILLGIFLLLALFGVSVFNKFIKNKNQVKDAWSNIDVALKRRYDLIPNLVETVKGYASHEKDTLERVIQARNAATVRENNTYGESFPGVIFAGMMPYQSFNYFEVDAAERENVKVDFS